MKYLLTLIIAWMSFMTSYAQEKTGGVTFTPHYVICGSTGDSIIYDPAGTVLENATNIKCVLYIYRNYWWQATDLAIEQKEGKWIGVYDAPEDARLIACKFYADGKTDWGWPATYASFVLDKNKKGMDGSRIAWAMLRTPNSGLTLPGMCEDSLAAPIAGEVQLMWFNNEFPEFPKSQPYAFKYLVQTLNRVKPGEKNEQLRQNMEYFLNDIEAKKLKLNDQQLSDMYDIALRTLTDSALAEKVCVCEKKLFPDGIISRDEELLRIQNLFGNIKRADENGKMIANADMQAQKEFRKFLKRFPTKKFLNASSFVTDLFYSKIFRSVIYTPIMLRDDYSELERYIHDIPYEELTVNHWHIVEVGFTNGQLTAEKVAPYSTLIVNEMLNRPQNTQAMQLYSPAEWDVRKVETHSMALFCHARVMDGIGNMDEAWKFTQMVYPYYTNRQADFADFYVKLLQKTGRDSDVIPYIKTCVATDAITQDMLDILRADYEKNKPANGDFDTYLASFKNEDKISRERARALSSLMNEPINLYELDRMGGGRVNLADKKGKILFLDFWATWCAPCKASMPGGQMAVNRWKDDENVEFYFIDTNETTRDYRRKAEDFIKSKGYTFTVLFDEGEAGSQDKVYKDYCKAFHTSGIPFKMIIDGEGRLRWMACGYHGSPTAMADEIGYVIEYLKNEKK